MRSRNHTFKLVSKYEKTVDTTSLIKLANHRNACNCLTIANIDTEMYKCAINPHVFRISKKEISAVTSVQFLRNKLESLSNGLRFQPPLPACTSLLLLSPKSTVLPVLPIWPGGYHILSIHVCHLWRRLHGSLGQDWSAPSSQQKLTRPSSLAVRAPQSVTRNQPVGWERPQFFVAE